MRGRVAKIEAGMFFSLLISQELRQSLSGRTDGQYEKMKLLLFSEVCCTRLLESIWTRPVLENRLILSWGVLVMLSFKYHHMSGWLQCYAVNPG